MRICQNEENTLVYEMDIAANKLIMEVNYES